MGKNIKWVTVSKGIVICLMVIGHTSIPMPVSNWIWSFHMPFFFIVSALFTSWNNSSFYNFVKHKTSRLIGPYIIYSIINLLFFPFALKISITTYFREVLTNGWQGVALWFIPVFYLSLVICKLIKMKWLPFLSFICFVAGSILCLDNIFLPWTLSSVPFACGMMMITRYYRIQILSILESFSYKDNIIVLLVGLFVSIVISQHWRLDMAFNIIEPFLPLMLGICGGTIFIFCISKIFERHNVISKVFGAIGKNTFEIMALSQVIIATENIFIQSHILIKYCCLTILIYMVVMIRYFIFKQFHRFKKYT